MKKFVILLFIFMTTLGRAAINPYTPNSQQWHNHNAAMWAEQDRIKAEREAMLEQQKIQQQNNQKSKEQRYKELVSGYYKDNPFQNEDVYSMVIFDENRGGVYWNLRFFVDNRLDDPAKVALGYMKDWFHHFHEVTSEQRKELSLKHYYFTLGETYSVVRGIDRVTKKWVLWIMRKTIPKSTLKEVEEEALEWCHTEGDSCEVVFTATIAKRNK